MRFRLVSAAIFIVSLLIPVNALAATETEPNNGIHQANGPLVAATDYNGTLSATKENDWFILYVSGQGALDVEATNLNDASNCYHNVWLLDSEGNRLNSKELEENDVDHLIYNTPGAGTYYVLVYGACAGDDYRLKASGPLTTGPTPGPPEPTTNGHNSAANALGPLEGDKLYGGVIDTTKEQDWFFFYVAGAGTFDITYTDINDGSNCYEKVALLDANGGVLNSKEVEEDEIRHLAYTASGAAKFLIRVEGPCPEDQYQFRITPASLLTSVPPPAVTPPPTTSKACKKARSEKSKALKKLGLATTKLGAATTRKQRRRLRKLVKKRRAAVKKASGQAKTVCT